MCRHLQENNRLIDLLSRMDLEKTHLQQALTSLQSAPSLLHASAAAQDRTIPAIHQPGTGGPELARASRHDSTPKMAFPTAAAATASVPKTATGDDVDALQQLRADLAAEQARRKQAEQDFQVICSASCGPHAPLSTIKCTSCQLAALSQPVYISKGPLDLHLLPFLMALLHGTAPHLAVRVS